VREAGVVCGGRSGGRGAALGPDRARVGRAVRRSVQAAGKTPGPPHQRGYFLRHFLPALHHLPDQQAGLCRRPLQEIDPLLGAPGRYTAHQGGLHLLLPDRAHLRAPPAGGAFLGDRGAPEAPPSFHAYPERRKTNRPP